MSRRGGTAGPGGAVDGISSGIDRGPKQQMKHFAVLPIRDGLPKMKDMPKEMGGSGETVPK